MENTIPLQVNDLILLELHLHKHYRTALRLTRFGPSKWIWVGQSWYSKTTRLKKESGSVPPYGSNYLLRRWLGVGVVGALGSVDPIERPRNRSPEVGSEVDKIQLQVVWTGSFRKVTTFNKFSGSPEANMCLHKSWFTSK